MQRLILRIMSTIALGNKNMKVSSLESNENTQRQSMGHIAQFQIMNPHQRPFLNWQRTPEECTAIS